MKCIKCFLFLLMLSAIFDVTIVNAETKVHRENIVLYQNNEYTITNSYTKISANTAQKFVLLSAKTTLTNPCPNCKILARLRYGNNFETYSAGVITATGNSVFPPAKEFHDPTTVYWPGVYKISAKRYDTTWLQTTINYDWYLDQ